ncbi:hypothetical protein HPB47_021176 [Ixodes persulcatus]|uniref:Uncharacterized protein n=1 Tax=Ixodes persulcatus TaxID=34615 RepID=A0AC60QF60_IXOPE|nr:hypothetical protein HPB47_021176 [Ixodes persulcatus]
MNAASDCVRNGYVELRDGTKVPVVNAMSAATPLTGDMPVAAGRLQGQAVTVLRDTGCNTVVMRRDLVSDESLTGRSSLVYLVDGTAKILPEARVHVQTPFYSGTITAMCMDSPLYDVILGNIPNVRAPGDPDVDWNRSDETEERAPDDKPENTGVSAAAAVAIRSREMISPETSRGKAPEMEQGVAHKETPTERCAAVPKPRKLEEDGVQTEGDGPENPNPAAKLPRKRGSSHVEKTRSSKKRRISWSRSSGSEDLPDVLGIAPDNKDEKGTLGPPERETSRNGALDGERRKVGARSERGGGDKDGVIKGKPAEVRAGGSKADSPASQPATHENGSRDPESCEGPPIVQPHGHLKERPKKKTARANSNARAKGAREASSLPKSDSFKTEKASSPSVRPTGHRGTASRRKTENAKNDSSVRSDVMKSSGSLRKMLRGVTAIKGNLPLSQSATCTQDRSARERDPGTKVDLEAADYAAFYGGARTTGHSKLSSALRRPRLGG